MRRMDAAAKTHCDETARAKMQVILVMHQAVRIAYKKYRRRAMGKEVLGHLTLRVLEAIMPVCSRETREHKKYFVMPAQALL